MAKRVSARRVKIHRQYTYDSAADALGVTTHTVRAWRAVGLAVLDSQKPHLILGHELRRFLEGRTPKKSRKLAPGEFYCMSCRAPRAPYGAMADYVPSKTLRGAGWWRCAGKVRRLAISSYRSRCAVIWPRSSPSPHAVDADAKRTPQT